MAELTLLKVPTDSDAQYQAMFAMFRRLTQHEPTLDDKNVVRLMLGLPPLTK